MRCFTTFVKIYPMNKHTKLFVIALLISLVTACVMQKKAIPDPEMEKQGYVKATVISYEIDGCSYMLELASDKSKLEPDGLQPDFQKDSLPVWIKYKAVDRMSICMAGATIDLLEIKKR